MAPSKPGENLFLKLFLLFFDRKQLKKLYSQNKLAGKLGISRGTLSKWLKKNSVSPKQCKGQLKLYDETVIQQYHRSQKDHHSSNSRHFSTIQLLQQLLQEKQQGNEDLKQQITQKDRLIEEKDQIISDFGKRFADLADHEQSLNLADKSKSKLKLLRRGKDNKVQRQKRLPFWKRWF